MITDFQVVKKEISPRYFLLTLALTPLQIAKKKRIAIVQFSFEVPSRFELLYTVLQTAT